ncbi:hypothetical protein Taro_056341 [Colocasia esculenta]|uniref:F-box domain-containing protein n=1 Tax=Colocasia esculenta TaxID=4460 RepID=A0A843XX21_COLES|nr:hypothetical protein [Colocasia esculenta]
MEGGAAGRLESLPGECISLILSFTSPRDVCRASAVSSAFRSPANSDLVWDRFLPRDWEGILGRCSSDPVPFSSRKELYFRLCDSVPIDDGTKRAWLERATGKKCFMLSARSLGITWGNDNRYWRWISVPDARFPEVAELLDVCWLSIEGSVSCRDLSPETRYGAYLVMRLSSNSYGLDEPPQETVITVGGVSSSTRSVRLQEQAFAYHIPLARVHYPWGFVPIQIDAGNQEEEETPAMDTESSLDEQPGEELHRLPGLPPEEGDFEEGEDEEEGSQPPWEAAPTMDHEYSMDEQREEGADHLQGAPVDGDEEEEEEDDDDVVTPEEGEEEEGDGDLLSPQEEAPSTDAGSSLEEPPREEGDSDASDCWPPGPDGDDVGQPAEREVVWVPEAREDGWKELPMGDFFVEAGGDELVEVLLKGWQAPHWKSGLIVQGIELRPMP